MADIFAQMKTVNFEKVILLSSECYSFTRFFMRAKLRASFGQVLIILRN